MFEFWIATILVYSLVFGSLWIAIFFFWKMNREYEKIRRLIDQIEGGNNG